MRFSGLTPKGEGKRKREGGGKPARFHRKKRMRERQRRSPVRPNPAALLVLVEKKGGGKKKRRRDDLTQASGGKNEQSLTRPVSFSLLLGAWRGEGREGRGNERGKWRVGASEENPEGRELDCPLCNEGRKGGKRKKRGRRKRGHGFRARLLC